jgi:hypothetical protein
MQPIGASENSVKTGVSRINLVRQSRASLAALPPSYESGNQQEIRVANPTDTKEEKEPKVLLIAQLRAFLISGESFDLLPIKHEQDVKSEVESLVESWTESGFLVHGRFIYPWHQVKHVEVTQVEEMPLELAHQRFDELFAAQRARLQEDFWRTRRKTEKKPEEKPDTNPPH